MHSIRMHTVRCSGHLGGGVSAQWGQPLGRQAQGLFAQMGVCLGGVCPGGMSTWGMCTSPPVERMTDACENITFRR